MSISDLKTKIIEEQKQEEEKPKPIANYPKPSSAMKKGIPKGKPKKESVSKVKSVKKMKHLEMVLHIPNEDRDAPVYDPFIVNIQNTVFEL